MHQFSFLFPVFLLIGSLQSLQLAPTSLTFQNPVDFNQTNISDTPCIPKIDTLDGQKVYRKGKKPCEFPGGQSEFSRYLYRNLRYPAHQDDMQDRVRLTFIVDTFGNIRNLCVLDNPDPTNLSPFDSTVVAMFQTMPRWVPAEMDGRKVYYRLIQSISVHLE
jgi:hypothetical protein